MDVETGGGGCGNDELESCTGRLENASQQNGNLVIKVLREKYTFGGEGVTRNYTSARLRRRASFRRLTDASKRALRFPRGQGIWPAFWMLGDDIDKPGWPACGEIDIMENVGKEPAMVHGTIHGPGYSGVRGPGSLTHSPPICVSPTTFTGSPSSGSPTRSASTSMTIFTRRAHPLICPKERNGFTTIRTSCC